MTWTENRVRVQINFNASLTFEVGRSSWRRMNSILTYWMVKGKKLAKLRSFASIHKKNQFNSFKWKNKYTHTHAVIADETEIHVIGVSHMMFMRTLFRKLYYFKHLNRRWYSNKEEMQKYRTIGAQEEKNGIKTVTFQYILCCCWVHSTWSNDSNKKYHGKKCKLNIHDVCEQDCTERQCHRTRPTPIALFTA